MICQRAGWTETSDNVVSCPTASGAVDDGEPIVRLLHNRNSEKPKERLKREELFEPRAGGIKNVCNDPLGSHGASLVRAGSRSDDELRALSKAYAEQKEGREPRGAIVGTAGAIRAVRSKIRPEALVVYVYDDPVLDDPDHCVIRVKTEHRSEGDFLRTEILRALDRTIDQ